MALEDPLTRPSPESLPGSHGPERTVSAPRLASLSVGIGSVTLWLGLLGLVTTPIMIHHLGATRYGVFALISIMSAYLMNLEFGFGTATVRFLARAYAAHDREEQQRVLGTSLAVFLVGGLGAALSTFLGATWIAHTFFHGPTSLRPEATDAIRLGAVILLLSFLASFASVSLQAIARFPVVVISRGVFGTLASVTAVAAVLVGGHLRLVLGAQAIVTGALCIVLLVSLLRALGLSARPRIYKGTFRQMASYGAFILISGLAYQVLLQGPPTVLAHLAPTAAVAAFAVPSVIMQQLVGAATSTSIGFMPFTSAASVDPDRSHVSAVYRSNLRITLLFVGPIALISDLRPHPDRDLDQPSIRVAGGSAASVSRHRGRDAGPECSPRGCRPAWGVLGDRWLHGAQRGTRAWYLVCRSAPLPGRGGRVCSCRSSHGHHAAIHGACRPAHPWAGPTNRAQRAGRPCRAAMRPGARFSQRRSFSDGFGMAIGAAVVGAAIYAVLAFRLILTDRERSALRRAARPLWDRLRRRVGTNS